MSRASKSWARRKTGAKPLRRRQALAPDIVVMDHTMPLLNGLEATRQLRKALPDVRVLILTMHTNEEYIFQFLQAGAAGYLVKQTAPTDLIRAIRTIYAGDSFLSPTISKAVIDEYVRSSEASGRAALDSLLTEREREILQLVAEGLTNQAIASQLHISAKTVGVHRLNLMQKLDLHNLADLTKYAIRMGIISVDG